MARFSVRKVIPLTPDRNQSKVVKLYNNRGELVSLRLTFRFNTRTDSWYVDVDDPAGNRVISGQRLAARAFLFSRFKYLRHLPAGIFYGTRHDDVLAEIGHSHLGREAIVFQFAEGDIAP